MAACLCYTPEAEKKSRLIRTAALNQRARRPLITELAKRIAIRPAISAMPLAGLASFGIRAISASRRSRKASVFAISAELSDKNASKLRCRQQIRWPVWYKNYNRLRYHPPCATSYQLYHKADLLPTLRAAGGPEQPWSGAQPPYAGQPVQV